MHTPSSHEALLGVIRAVRARWRLKAALRGAGVLLASALLLFVLSAWGMDRLRFGTGAVLAFRLLTWGGLAAVAWRFLVRPLRRRVADETVALYLEEHEPTLEGTVVSAVESSAGAAADLSPALVRRLVESAVERCAQIEGGRRVERTRLYRSSGLVVGVTAAALAVTLFPPSFLRHAAPLLLPWTRASSVHVYGIRVTPGNARLARGADQRVSARLTGFETEQVDISLKTGSAGKWERAPMALDQETGEYAYLMLDVDDRTEYFVEASGVRSPLYHLDVADIPYVKQLDLEYHYPAYTGLAPEKVEDGGDIAALQGTEVLLRATPTIRAGAGRIKVEGQPPVPMTVGEDGKLAGTIRVERPGFYRIELQGPDGSLAVASPDYGIDVLPDRPPTVSFSKPGRDTRVTPIEEVFAEARAEDDYGIKSLELVYSVNGAPEKTVPLFQSGPKSLKEISAGHTFFLEELSLEPGDFISYFARATDSRPGPPQVASTDIYFMQVTPFGREYRAAESRGGMPGGMNGGADGALSQRQREIIAATFKLLRDRGQYLEREYRENLTTIKLAQAGLRQQVEALVQRMSNRGVAGIDSGFKKIGEALPQAAKEMEAAEAELDRSQPKEALPPEQRALKFLQRAEAVFRDVQVSMGNQAGGGGGAFPNAEDLADLFELELDKLQNQYETVQRGQRQEMANQLDETLQRLRELARRQEQENERARRLGSSLQQAGGAGGGQRQLAQEAEELARKLERLAREQSLPDLENTARRLQQAAEAMRRGSTASKDGRLASGLSALDQLEEARRLLEKNRTDRLSRDAADALRQADELRQQQQKIETDVQGLKPTGQNPPEQMIRLLQRKDQLAQGVQALEGQLDRMSRDAGRERREAGRKLEDAANAIREDKLKEKIRYSKGVVAGRSPEYAREFEKEITKGLDQLRTRIADAASATAGESKENRLGTALDRARDLARGMEALDERIRRRQESRPSDGQAGGSPRRGANDPSSQRSNDPSSGQPGEQGQDAQGQAPGQGGQRASGGRFSPGAIDGGNGRAFAPGGYTADDVRQFQREFRERRRDAETLRQELLKGGLSGAELRDLIDRLKALEDARVYGDPLAFERLRASVLEGVKQFEYGLRRKIEGADREQLFLSGSEDVPAGYRELVEEYYRSLARTPK